MAKMKRPATVSKTEFANMIGVGPAQVGRYLRQSILDGPAIRREGRNIRIVVTIAKKQLAERLAPPTSGRRLYGASVAGGNHRSLSEKLKREILISMRHRNARLERERIAFGARHVRKADLDRVLAKLPGMTLDFIERALPSLVDAVAATFGVPTDEVATLVGDEMRRVRARAAAAGGRPMGGVTH